MSKKPPNWSAIGKRSRAKGAAFERLARAACEKLWFREDVKFTRIRPETAQRLGAGDLAPLDAQLRLVPGFSYVIECKHYVQLNTLQIDRWIQELMKNNPRLVPVFIYRVNNGPVTVICPSSLEVPLPWHLTSKRIKLLRDEMNNPFFLPSWTFKG